MGPYGYLETFALTARLKGFPSIQFNISRICRHFSSISAILLFGVVSTSAPWRVYSFSSVRYGLRSGGLPVRTEQAEPIHPDCFRTFVVQASSSLCVRLSAFFKGSAGDGSIPNMDTHTIIVRAKLSLLLCFALFWAARANSFPLLPAQAHLSWVHTCLQGNLYSVYIHVRVHISQLFVFKGFDFPTHYCFTYFPCD